MKKSVLLGLALLLIAATVVNAQTYHMPGEDLEHEGTWLQWPHNNLYGPWYQGEVEPAWVVMTNALQSGEKVHIIAVDEDHKEYIIDLLTSSSVPLTNVDFYVFPNDDVWVRDNGPIFVYDENDDLTILDFGFNGWGGDTPYSLCDVIPQNISDELGIPRIDLSDMVLEGGAIEHDGHGTMMATRSSVTHSSRNPNLTEAEIEAYLTTYMGITNFIWLDGIYGQDITDQHIDGFVKFANDSTILTMNNSGLYYWYVSEEEIDIIQNATNAAGVPYNIVTVPLTENNVTTAYGSNLGYKGSYVNYYIGNEVVLVPIYDDPNDDDALAIIQGLYPNREVIGVDVRNLYEYGGMIHCVTQQQPIFIEATVGLVEEESMTSLLKNIPNPVSTTTEFIFTINETMFVELTIYNAIGQVVAKPVSQELNSGEKIISLDVSAYASGVYYYQLSLNGLQSETKKMLIE